MSRLVHLYAGYFRIATEISGLGPMAMESSATTEMLSSISRLKEGFGGVAVRGIVEDKEGNVWFGTERGNEV